MVNGVNEKFNIPFAHHFIVSLNAERRKELHVSYTTFDGLSANSKMCRLLGAALKPDSLEFNPSFKIQGKPIQMIYDNCHMMKLVRNSLGRREILYDSNGAEIKWEHLKKLVEFKISHGLQLMHKLNHTHLNWKKNPMKVDLAVQTLSASTANSLAHLTKAGYVDFAEAGPTVKFVQTFNDLFDIFNSKCGGNANHFKNILDCDNEQKVFDYFEEATDYIKALKVKTEKGNLVNIIQSKIRTGFVGFLANLVSLQNMYSQFVERDQNMSGIATFSLQQDPLELFFGKVRSLNGFNDNPTIQQFSAALRKLLACDSTVSSMKSNCKGVSSDLGTISDICYVSSKKCTTQGEISQNIPNTHEEISKKIGDLFRRIASINEVDFNVIQGGLKSVTTAQIAIFIERKLRADKYIRCSDCKNFLNEEKCTEMLDPELQEVPCISTCEICTVVENFMKLELLYSMKLILRNCILK